VTRGLLRWYYLLLLLLLYLPLGMLLLFSINEGTSLSFPLRGVTFDWYRSMFDNGQLLGAVGNSALVASGAATAATILGTCASLAITRFDFRGKGVFLLAALLPLVVPFIILGVSLLILFSALGVSRSLWTVAAGHTVVALPFALLVMMARLVGFPRSVEEAARDLGASYFYTLRRVIVPMVAPAMLAAWLVAFTVSVDEFVIASFTVGRDPTLPVYIFGQLRFANRFPQVVALSTLTMLVSIGLVVLAERLRRSGPGEAKAA